MLPLISFISLALVVRGDARFNAPPLRQCEGALHQSADGRERRSDGRFVVALRALEGAERTFALAQRRRIETATHAVQRRDYERDAHTRSM